LAQSVYSLRYGLDERGSVSSWDIDGIYIPLRHRCVQTHSESHPASCQMGIGAVTPGVKWRKPEVDHSPPPSSDVKNAWSYASSPAIHLHGVMLK
jgi:hypothetical protein